MDQALAQSAGNGNGFRWDAADAYLFDVDGTLLRSYDRTHRAALHRAMADVYGVETTIDGIAYHGKTDPGILRAALDRAGLSNDAIDTRMHEALAGIRRHAEENAALFTPTLMPSIPEILEFLRDQGKLLAICSGNLEAIGWLKVRVAGLRPFFQFGCFADECELREHVFGQGMAEAHRRLGPQARVCFVGDTPEDVLAAQKVGARVIAVGTGIYKAEDLAMNGPDFSVASFAELLSRP